MEPFVILECSALNWTLISVSVNEVKTFRVLVNYTFCSKKTTNSKIFFFGNSC